MKLTHYPDILAFIGILSAVYNVVLTPQFDLHSIDRWRKGI
jgi:hypothetical protein